MDALEHGKVNCLTVGFASLEGLEFQKKRVRATCPVKLPLLTVYAGIADVWMRRELPSGASCILDI